MKKQLLFLSLFTINLLIAQVPSYVPTNGLVGYWPFNENANDVSGNGNNGTINGATLTSDRFGNNNTAYNYDGLSNFIEVPSSVSLQVNSAYTISCWVILDIQNYLTIDQHSIVSKIADGDWYGGYELRINNLSTINNVGAFSISGNIGGINTSLGSTNVISGQWYLVTVTYNSSILKIYLNNLETGSSIVSGNLQTSNNRLRFGRRGEGNSFNCWFKGKIDDIGIWNRALTQSEITSLYTTLNTEQTPANNQITVYPNPAKEQITIDCGTISNASGWSYKIVNTIGQEVLNGEINSPQNVVFLNSLKGTGVYLVKIYDVSNNLLNTKKIVLQ